jgi:transposase-like protein
MKLTLEERREFAEMWNRGETISAMAARFNRGQSAIRKLRVHLGLPPRFGGISIKHIRLMRARDAEIWEMSRNGVTASQIARRYGINTDSVYNSLERHARVMDIQILPDRKCLRCRKQFSPEHKHNFLCVSCQAYAAANSE